VGGGWGRGDAKVKVGRGGWVGSGRVWIRWGRDGERGMQLGSCLGGDVKKGLGKQRKKVTQSF